jgi:hypothetical protein
MRIKSEKCGTINTGDFVSNCKCCGQRLQKQIEEYNDKMSKAKVNQVKIKGKDKKNEKETFGFAPDPGAGNASVPIITGAWCPGARSRELRRGAGLSAIAAVRSSRDVCQCNVLGLVHYLGS